MRSFLILIILILVLSKSVAQRTVPRDVIKNSIEVGVLNKYYRADFIAMSIPSIASIDFVNIQAIGIKIQSSRVYISRNISFDNGVMSFYQMVPVKTYLYDTIPLKIGGFTAKYLFGVDLFEKSKHFSLNCMFGISTGRTKLY